MGSRFNHAPSFLDSLPFSPLRFLVDVRFPVVKEAVLGCRAAALRAFLVEDGAVTPPFPDFSSLDSIAPLVGVSGESEVRRRFESCFGLLNG
jgi:hypothetical protein